MGNPPVRAQRMGFVAWEVGGMSLIPADPTVLHPIPGQPRVVLRKPLVTSPLIGVGEFSYSDDAHDPTAFETRNVL